MSSRFLAVVRALAIPSGLVTAAACGSPPPANTVPPAPSGSTSASSAAAAPSNVVASSEHEVQSDPTEGTGPCRCSWDTKQAAAPRVCKKGETSHDGKVCKVVHYKYPKYPIKVGPLDPPEL